MSANNPTPESHSKDVKNFFYTNRLPQYQHPQMQVGDFTHGRPSVHLASNVGKLVIGKFCSVSNDAKFIIGGKVDERKFSTYPFGQLRSEWPNTPGAPISRREDIVIGNDVSVGAFSTIVSGVTIGDGAIIREGSFVCQDIEPYTIVAGNPAVAIKRRFNSEFINMLLQLQWWNWSVEKIKIYTDILVSDNPDRIRTLYHAECEATQMTHVY